MVKAQNIVICITGTMTSGKGALQYFLIDRGFKAIRHTQPILDYGLKKKLDMKDRANWFKSVATLRKKFGMQVLAKKADEKIEEEERYVICPIRNPEDLKYFKNKYNALIIYVDAPVDLRYKRTYLKELGVSMTREEFEKKDKFEYDPKGEDRKYYPNIRKCKEMADAIIINDKTLNDLNTELEKVLRKYKIPDLIDTDSYEDFDV